MSYFAPTFDAAAIVADVAAVEADVTTLQSDLSTASGEIDTLQTALGTAEGEIDTLQTDVTALEAVVPQTALEPLQTITVSGASVNTVSITELGDAQAIRIVVRWVKSTTTDHRLFLAPNGLTTDQKTVYSQGDSGGGSGDLSFTQLLLCLGDRGTIAQAEAVLQLATGQFRTLTVAGGCGSDASDPAQYRNFQGYGAWLDSSTAVTKVDVQCRSGLGLVNNLAAGTVITVFKVY